MEKRKSLLKDFSEQELNNLYSNAEILTFQPGGKIIRKGEIEEAMYLILKGKAKVTVNARGKEKILTLMGMGHIFGEMSFVSRQPRSVNVTAVEPSRIMKIDRDILEGLDPQIQIYFYKIIGAVAVQRINRVEEREKKLSRINAKLVSQHFTLATKKSCEIRESVFINDVVKKVPRLPLFAISLAGKLFSDQITPRQVSEEVKKDPSLAATILKTINSPLYNLPDKVADLHHAIMLLGYNTVTQIVVSEGIKRSLPNSSLFRKLYNHSLAISCIAFELSCRFSVDKPSEIATISILHELGEVVIQLLKEKNPKIKGLFDMMEHPPMTRMLLESWGLPDVICDTVDYQFYPEFSTPDKIPKKVRDKVGILFISHLCHDLIFGKNEEEMPMIFYELYLKNMGQKQTSLFDLVNQELLPALFKKQETMPAFLVEQLRDFVMEHNLFNRYQNHFKESY